MRQCSKYLLLGVALWVLFLTMGCNRLWMPHDTVSSGVERAQSFDRQKFTAYLDTTTVDDWEGVWLLVGPELHCYLAIERINDMAHMSYYTHRIILWNTVHLSPVFDVLRYEQGHVVGYLSQGMYEDVKTMTLNEGFLIKRSVYKGVVQLDKNNKYILIDVEGYKLGTIGMRRIYPIRSYEEREYKVRYL